MVDLGDPFESALQEAEVELTASEPFAAPPLDTLGSCSATGEAEAPAASASPGAFDVDEDDDTGAEEAMGDAQEAETHGATSSSGAQESQGGAPRSGRPPKSAKHRGSSKGGDKPHFKDAVANEVKTLLKSYLKAGRISSKARLRGLPHCPCATPEVQASCSTARTIVPTVSSALTTAG